MHISWHAAAPSAARGPVAPLTRRGAITRANTDEGGAEAEVEIKPLKAPPTREEVRRMVDAKKPEWISKDFRPAANIRSASKKIEISSISETVSNRMVKRVVIFSGIPFTISAATLLILALKAQEWGISTQSVTTSQTFLFVLSFLGISYGIISSSWTDEVEGTLLGWREFKANLPVAIDRIIKMR